MGQKQTKREQSVKVVNIKKREDAQSVYPDSPSEQPTRPVSITSEQKSPASVRTLDSESSEHPSENMIETVVGSISDFKDGQMQEVDVGDKKVLLVKEDGQFFAVSSKCTHYGAPLSKGAYCKGIVRCPWHGACFDVKTGDIEDYPGLDSLQKYQVEVKDGKVVVQANPAALENSKRVKAMVKKSADNKKTVVLVGGGPATLVCAETLRQEGYTGRIIIVSQEEHLPYDRIKLSKALNSKPGEIALRSQEFYDQNGIELLLGKKVTQLQPDEKKVVLEDGQGVSYDVLVLATGGKPRILPVPGSDLKNVYLLRTPKDANAIAENSQGKNVVIIGSSFIGMEVTAYLADKAASVSVVDLVQVPFQLTLGSQIGKYMQKRMSSSFGIYTQTSGLEVANYMVGKAAVVNVIGQSATPLAHVFGAKIGEWFRKLHEEKGVHFHFETSVKELRGEGGYLREAELANGTTLPADVCVMGVGVVPATDFLKDSGLNLTSRGFVSVNKHMQTNLPDVYAAGDIVEFPLFTADNQSVNIQHWQMAHQHGRIAGLSIAGKSQDIHSVPYFWTMQYGKSIRYTGYGPGYEDVILHGDLDENKFVAYYTKNDKVVAVASLGWDPIVSQAAELMSKGGTITKDEIKSDPDSWVSRLATV